MHNSAEPVSFTAFIISNHILSFYIKLLGEEDEKAVEVGLEGIRNFLIVGDKVKGTGNNPILLELSATGGINHL